MASKAKPTRILVLALVLMSPAVRAEAQLGTPALTVGQRVRITSAAHRMSERVGIVTAVSGDTLIVQVNTVRRSANGRWIAGTDTAVMSRQSIDRLEVSRRKGSRAGTGAVIGSLAGALVGGFIAASSYEPCTPEPGNLGVDCLVHDVFEGTSPSNAALPGAVGGALLGAGLGALIGSMVRWERWEEVSHGAVSVQGPNPPTRGTRVRTDAGDPGFVLAGVGGAARLVALLVYSGCNLSCN